MRIIDVSLEIKPGMIVYPGNSEPKINPVRRVPESSTSISEIILGSHTGTHIDTKLHIEQNPLEEIIARPICGECRVLDLTECKECIKEEDLIKKKFKNSIVLLKTANSLNGYEKFNENFVYLREDAARYLVGNGVKVIGFDYLSVQKFRQGNQNTHKNLLDSAYVIEGLNLAEAVERSYFLICAPLKVNGIDGVPARVLLIDQSPGS